MPTKTQEQKLAAIREKVIEAKGHCIDCYPDEPQIGTSYPNCALNGRCECHDRFRLADIIFTHSSLYQRYLNIGYISGDRLNGFEAAVLDIVARWNEKEDDLYKSPQTWDFLYDLLIPKAETQSSKEA